MGLSPWIVAGALALAAPAFADSRERIERDGVAVDYPIAFRGLARSTARYILEAREQLARWLGITYARPIHCSIHDNEAEFLAATHGHPTGPWVIGVAIPHFSTIAIRGTHPDTKSEDYPRELRHEVCHLFVGQFAAQGGVEVPLWFDEGLAEWASGRNIVRDDEVAVLCRNGLLIPFVQLETRFPGGEDQERIAFWQSESLVRFVIDRFGFDAVRGTLDRAGRGVRFADGFREATQREFSEIVRDWEDYLRGPSSQPNLLDHRLPFVAVFVLALGALVIVWFCHRRRRGQAAEMGTARV